MKRHTEIILNSLTRAELLLDQARQTDERLQRRLATAKKTLDATSVRQITKRVFVESRFNFIHAICERSERRLNRRSALIERLKT